MPRKKKEQKEKYIKIRISPNTGLTTYQVFIEPSVRSTDERYTASFAEKDYGSKDEAFAAARRDRDRALKQIDMNGSIAKARKKTISECFNEMIEYRAFDKSTKKMYKRTFNHVYKDEVGAISIIEANITHIRKCVAAHENNGQSRIDTIENVMRQTFDYAYRANYIESNPYDRFYEKVKSKKLEVPKDQELNYEEVQIILKHLENTSNRPKDDFKNRLIKHMIILIHETGIRPSEALALKKGHFDFEAKRFKLYTSLDSVRSDDGSFNIKTTKSKAGERIMPMSDLLVKTMKELFEFQPSEFLFADYFGKLCSVNDISSKIGYISKKYDIGFNMYKLRHNFATDLISNNVDPRTIVELMGHKHLNMSIYYARSNDELKHKAIGNLKSLN